MVSVDNNSLISQIVSLNPELKKEDLQKLSDTELQAKLAQSLSGDKLGTNTDQLVATSSNVGIEPNTANLTKEEAEDSAIQTINDNAEQAQKMIDNQDDGVISKTYDKYKEATDSELAKSNVQDVVDKQSQTAEFLQEAKDGKLTYKDYLERKRGLLYKSLPDIDSFTDKQKEVFEKCIKTLNPEQINALQYELSTLPKDKDKYKDAKLKFYGLFRNMSMTEQKSNVTVDKTNFKTTKYIQNKEFIPKNGDRLMTFEEVYQLEQGVEFKKENIQKYNESITKFALASKLSKTKETVDKSISRALEQYNVDSTTGLNSTDLNNANLALTLKGAIAQIYGKDKVAEGLKDLTDGKYILDDDTKSIEELTNKYHGSIKDIAKLIQTKINERCDKAMGGKSLEDYAKTMAKDYKNAYGFRDANALANSFAQDQEGIVQAARNGVQIAGTLIMVGGMAFFPPLALVGGLIASFGGIGVEALNESTKENVSSEKMDELKKEFAQNAALFAVGAGAGKLGSSAKAMLTAKNAPKFVAMIGDIGVDSTVSLIGDLVLTGDLDITGEGFSQVMSLVAGHKGKIVKGVQHLKEKINDKFRLQNENPNRNIMQMPDGTLVEVKPDGSTVEIKTDEVSPNNHSSEQPIEWKKVNIGGEEIEVAMTRDASGNTSIDFSRARRLNADGKYEEFKVTTQEHLLADEVQNSGDFAQQKVAIKEEADSLLKKLDEDITPAYRQNSLESKMRYDNIMSCYESSPEAFVSLFSKIGFNIPLDRLEIISKMFKEYSTNEIKPIISEVDTFYKKLPKEEVIDIVNGEVVEHFEEQVANKDSYINLLIMKMYNPKTYNYLMNEENPLRTQALLSSWEYGDNIPPTNSFLQEITPNQLCAMGEIPPSTSKAIGSFVESSDEFYSSPRLVKSLHDDLAQKTFPKDVELYRGEKTTGMFDSISIDINLSEYLKSLVERNKTKAQNLYISKNTGYYQEPANTNLYEYIMQKENLTLADAMQIVRFGSEKDIETIIKLIQNSEIIDTRFKSLSFDRGMSNGWKNIHAQDNTTILHTANVKQGTQGCYHDTNNGQFEVILNNTPKKMTFENVVYDKNTNTFYMNTSIINI